MTCADSLNPSLGFAAVFGSGRGGVGDAHDAQQRRQAIRSLLAGQPHVSPDGRLRVLRTGGYVRYGDHADEVCFLLDDAQVPLAVARLGDFVDSGVFRVAGHDDSIPDGELPRRHITKDELIQDGTLRTALVQCGVLSEVDALAALKVTGPQRDLLSLLKRGFHIRYERLPQPH